MLVKIYLPASVTFLVGICVGTAKQSNKNLWTNIEALSIYWKVGSFWDKLAQKETSNLSTYLEVFSKGHPLCPAALMR